MEETTESFDFSAILAPSPAPAIVEDEKVVDSVPEPEPEAVPVVEEEKVVVPEPTPIPVAVEEEKVVVVPEPLLFPAPVFIQEENRVVSPPTAVRPIILPGVPTPSRPFKLRFGLRNKM